MPKTLIERKYFPFAPPDTDVFGLTVFSEKWKDNTTGKETTYWKSDVPNGVQIVALTPDNQIIAISEFQSGVGTDYIHVPGETIEEGEDPLTTAARGLLEETGYASTELILLSTILHDSSRSNRVFYFVLARNCIKRQVGEKEIKVKLFSPETFLGAMMKYFSDDREKKHGGANTLKAISLAFYELGWLNVAIPTP